MHFSFKNQNPFLTNMNSHTHARAPPCTLMHARHHAHSCTRATTHTHARVPPRTLTHARHHAHSRTRATTHTHARAPPRTHGRAPPRTLMHARNKPSCLCLPGVSLRTFCQRSHKRRECAPHPHVRVLYPLSVLRSSLINR